MWIGEERVRSLERRIASLERAEDQMRHVWEAIERIEFIEQYLGVELTSTPETKQYVKKGRAKRTPRG